MLLLDMKAYVDISAYWPKGDDGEPVSVNSVYTRFVGTKNKLTYQTLEKALNGSLESGKFVNLFKLAKVCSELSGKVVEVADLLVKTDD